MKVVDEPTTNQMDNILQEMAERGKCEGIIQDAVLIGAPCSGNPAYWKTFSRVVAGRLINGYCKSVYNICNHPTSIN